MKTTIEVLRLIPDSEILGNLIKEIKSENLSILFSPNLFEEPSNELMCVIKFGETTQGIDYWSNVVRKLKEINS